MDNKVALAWLQKITDTVARLDIQAHINLISKSVNLTGIPGFEVIGHADWVAQCQHEFKHKLLKSVEYEGLVVLAVTDNRVMFKTLEKVLASDGVFKQQGIEVLLEFESDAVWRVIQERVLSDDEAKKEGLMK